MGHSILLVDSNPDTAEMYAVGLRLAGFDPAVAATLSEGCAQLRRNPPDALVAGVRDASDDGWLLLRTAQADARTRHIPVFVLTAWLGERLANVAREAGCAALLGTPCLPATLASILRCVLGSSSNAGHEPGPLPAPALGCREAAAGAHPWLHSTRTSVADARSTRRV